jgi:serine protease AprX
MEVARLMPYAPNIVFRMRWMIGIALLAIAAIVPATLARSGAELPSTGSAPVAAAPLPSLSPALADVAARTPGKPVEVIVQMTAGTERAAAAPLVRSLGGDVTRDLHIINAVVATLPAAGARELAARPEVRAVSPNGAMKPQAKGDALSTSFNQSIQSPYLWNTYRGTGRGVGVAVIDTGIAGDLPDFRISSADNRSRVIGSAVVNPDATTATDRYGHGTHVAGIIAGDSDSRPLGDPKKGRFLGVAPGANLVSIKVSDNDGNTSVLDVIAGIQFAMDHKAEYNIRVLNLSLESTVEESYKTDPLDAAVEAAWFDGIFVVAAAGNRGPGGTAVSHAPGNDPYIVTVGAVDDQGTREIGDDKPASWSSRGTTQDGFNKPDVYAPGARIVSTLAPDSAYSDLCASCVSEGGEYIRAGGTSMAAPMVAGAAAIGFQLVPSLTPDRIKALLRDSDRPLTDAIDELSLVDAARRFATDGGRLANQGLTPNEYIDPATGRIDYTRSSWSRSSWSTASDLLRSSWSRSSWSMAPAERPADGYTDTVDPARSSWSRSSWSRSSWSTSWSK